MTHRFPQLHHLVFEEEVIDGSDPFFAVMATSKMSDHAGRARIFELQDRTADLALRLRSVITNVEEEPRNRPLQMVGGVLGGRYRSSGNDSLVV